MHRHMIILTSNPKIINNLKKLFWVPILIFLKIPKVRIFEWILYQRKKLGWACLVNHPVIHMLRSDYFSQILLGLLSYYIKICSIYVYRAIFHGTYFYVLRLPWPLVYLCCRVYNCNTKTSTYTVIYYPRLFFTKIIEVIHLYTTYNIHNTF